MTAARFRQMPTTTTIAVRPSGRPLISARSVVAQPRQQMTTEQAKDPEQVARTINTLQAHVASSTRSLRNEPETGAIIFQGVAVTHGVAFVLTHNFGRPFQGYRVTRTYLPASAAIGLQDAAMPAGRTITSCVALLPTGTGTCDIRVW